MPRGLQRDQFEIERTIDETLNAFTAGVEHRWNKVTLLVDERVQTFDNAIEMFLLSLLLGENASDLATLSLFTLDQSSDYRSRGHTVRHAARPAAARAPERRLAGRDARPRHGTAGSAAGTTPTGAPFATAVTGAGRIDRDIDQAGVDFGVAVGEHVRVVGCSVTARSIRAVASSTARHVERALEHRYDGLRGGCRAGAVRESSVISAGMSNERRRADYFHDQSGDAVAAAEATTRRGYFTRVAFDPSRALEISASVETNDIDAHSFTLSSPTASRRYKIKIRQRWNGGWSLSGSYRRTDLDNSGPPAGPVTQARSRCVPIFTTRGCSVARRRPREPRSAHRSDRDGRHAHGLLRARLRGRRRFARRVSELASQTEAARSAPICTTTAIAAAFRRAATTGGASLRSISAREHAHPRRVSLRATAKTATTTTARRSRRSRCSRSGDARSLVSTETRHCAARVERAAGSVASKERSDRPRSDGGERRDSTCGLERIKCPPPNPECLPPIVSVERARGAFLGFVSRIFPFRTLLLQRMHDLFRLDHSR